MFIGNYNIEVVTKKAFGMILGFRYLSSEFGDIKIEI
jgi:hypothetical protein